MNWDGRRWRIDDTLQVYDLARAEARIAAAQAIQVGLPRGTVSRLSSARTAASIVQLAKSDRRHASLPDDWDLDPWLLNTPDGTVDLTTGDQRAHLKSDKITKITAVSPSGSPDLWLSFLDQVFQSDADLINYVKRMVGYSLTGSTREHALFFLYGTGGNGKSVFLNTIHKVLNDYSQIAGTDTFVASNSDRHPTDLAMLRGARTVIAQETEQGQRWAEAKIKSLTGGDPISARFMRQDFFTFYPSFKLLVSGNHKPALSNVDQAMKRRIQLIPFGITIPKSDMDLNLEFNLKNEWPAILKWAIEGAVEWFNDGLSPPSVVTSATENYLADEDLVGKFINECCTTGDNNALTELNELFLEWTRWCSKNNEHSGTSKKFSNDLSNREFAKVLHPSSRRACFRSITLAKEYNRH